jgi:hypothetical protein
MPASSSARNTPKAQGFVPVDVEPQLRGFDGRLAGQADGPNLLDTFDVMVGHPAGFGQVADVLTKAGEDAVDALSGKRPRRLQHVVERLAGHEPRHRSPYERRANATFAQPPILGRRQEQGTHDHWPRAAG